MAYSRGFGKHNRKRHVQQSIPPPSAMAARPTVSAQCVCGVTSPNPGADCWWRGQINGPQSTWHGQTTWLATKFLCLADLGFKLRVQRRPSKHLARSVLVLSSSEFEHFFEEGPSEMVYAGTPVRDLTQYAQGRLCQAWARKLLQERNPTVEILDPEVELCCNGMRRGPGKNTYDFRFAGRRVKVKSAKMSWRSWGSMHWMLRFSSVKLGGGEHDTPPFDELYLVIISPVGLTLIHHDLVTGVHGQGKSTKISGHEIRLYGAANTDCWEDALREILEKLSKQGGCKVVAEKPLGELGFDKLLSQGASQSRAAVAGIPMSSMSPERRGNRVQQIGLAIDRKLHPRSTFSFTEGNRGKSNAPADWVRGKVRVELKSCGLTFNRSRDLWRCYFRHVKPDLFDELWLGLYTSIGIRFYRSQSCERLAFCKDGVRTEIRGHTLEFCGPLGELDPLKAFQVIEAKMISTGCELVAVVEWEKRGIRCVGRVLHHGG